MSVAYAVLAALALFEAGTWLAVFLGLLNPRHRPGTSALPRYVLRRKGLGHMVAGTGGLFWSIGSLIDPDRSVLLAWVALPFWIVGIVVVASTLGASTSGR